MAPAQGEALSANSSGAPLLLGFLAAEATAELSDLGGWQMSLG